jgi:hypothetical protein
MPAGFPEGISGMAEEIDGAMQHAPQPCRQSMDISLFFCSLSSCFKAGVSKRAA